MNSEFYVKTIEECRKMHLMRELEEPTHNYFLNGFMVFETRLDLGRRTQKTKGAFDFMKRSNSSLNIYVAHTLNAAQEAKRLNGATGCDVLTGKVGIINHFRGRRIEHQAINLIFDECDLTHNERMDIVYNTIMHCVQKRHPLAYIHVISLGM